MDIEEITVTTEISTTTTTSETIDTAALQSTPASARIETTITSPPLPPPDYSAMKPLPLTLIVATTPSGGIGLTRSLPWSLPRDLAFFKNMTQRLPQPPYTPPRQRQAHASDFPCNAVIMGRKTWESLPGRAKPLRARWNIVVSEYLDSLESKGGGSGRKDGFVGLESMKVVKNLAGVRGALEALGDQWSGRAFVIGGGRIYDAVMNEGVPGCVINRAVMTVVERMPQGKKKIQAMEDVKCDTFFEGAKTILRGLGGWKRKPSTDLAKLTGMELYEVDGWFEDEEQGIHYEFRLYERNVGEVAGELIPGEEEGTGVEAKADEEAMFVEDDLAGQDVVERASEKEYLEGKEEETGEVLTVKGRKVRRLSGSRPSSREREREKENV